jgi:hypothetical protein
MKLYGSDGGELMDVAEIERDGNALLIRGKVFGAMPIAARLSPAEARAGLKLLTPGLIWFLLTFLFRRD